MDEVDESPMSLLVADVGDDHRVAIPLAPVDRLEELVPGSIKPSPTGSVTDYRGETLALVALSEALGIGDLDDRRGAVAMVVHTRSGRRVGLMVGRIVDIIDPVDGVPLRPGSARHGVTGVTVVQDQVTDLVDVEAIFDQIRWHSDT